MLMNVRTMRLIWNKVYIVQIEELIYTSLTSPLIKTKIFLSLKMLSMRIKLASQLLRSLGSINFRPSKCLRIFICIMVCLDK